MKEDRKSRSKVQAAQIIIPSAAAAIALTGCADTGGSDSNDTDNIIDNPNFISPVTVTGLPGDGSILSSYTLFQPSLVDMDGDGDLDIYAGTSISSYISYSNSNIINKVLYIRNITSGETLSFEHKSDIFTNLPQDTISAMYNSMFGPMFVAAGDIDKDGDIDVSVASNNKSWAANNYAGGHREFLANTATSFPAGTITRSSDNSYTVSFVDLDGDTHLDKVIGHSYYYMSPSSFSGINLSYRLNNADGSGTFSSTNTIFSDNTVSSLAKLPIPSFADLDNDGDQDMFVVTYDTGEINYYENTGSTASPSFTSRTDNFNLSPTGGVKWFPAFGDMDGDGDLDAMIGTSDGKILYAENIDIE